MRLTYLAAFVTKDVHQDEFHQADDEELAAWLGKRLDAPIENVPVSSPPSETQATQPYVEVPQA
jgi:hypothetical protein